MKPRELDDRIEALYGRCDWALGGECLHVAAIQGPSGRVIAIGPTSPSSASDRFALGLARARAGVILTTGAILRAEPDLVHCYSEDPDENTALTDWRRRILGRAAPPRLLVLSGSGDLPADAPAFKDATGWVWTTPRGAAHLGEGPVGFSVIATEEIEVGAAIRFAWARDDALPILIEAGPTTTASLYGAEGSTLVDELLLSRFEGALLETAMGPAFIDADRLARVFGEPLSSVVVEEASGTWRFTRCRSRDNSNRADAAAG